MIITKVSLRLAAVACVMGLALPVATRGREQLPSQHPLTIDEVRQLLSAEAGGKVDVASGMQTPYLSGDFNGDGVRDVAVVVNIEEGRESLRSNGIRYINIDPYSKENGRELDPANAMGKNCMGLLLINGAAAQSRDKYLIYDCFSSIALLRKGAGVPVRGRSKRKTPRSAGDSIMLDMENGSRTLIYWTRTGYRGFGLSAGD